MATKIASLFAEIGVDSTKLDNGLKNAKEGMKETSEGAKGLSLDFSELNQAMELGSKVAEALKQVYEQTVGATVELAQKTEDLMDKTGMSAEQAGILNAQFQDLGLSTDLLQRAFDAAIRKGYEPTIDGLQKMRTEYNAIQDPIAQTKWLMDTFGRSGAEMAEYFKQSDKALNQMADSAKRAGVVMDENGVESAKQYSIQVNELNQQLEGLKVSIGTDLIPPLMQAAVVTNKNIDAIHKHQDSILDYLPVFGLVREAQKLFSKDTDANTDALANNYQAMGEASHAVEAAGPIWQGNSYQMEMAAMSTQHVTENLGTLQKITDPVSLAVEDMNSRVGAGTATWDSLAGSVNSAYQAMLNIIKTSPQVLQLLKDYGAASGQHDTHAENVNSIAGAGSDVNNGYGKTQGGAGQAGYNGQTPGTGGTLTPVKPSPGQPGYTPTGHAHGGSWTIPSGYGNEGYVMPDGNTASGGEGITVTPKGKSTAGTVINQYFYGLAVPVSPTQEIAAIKAMLATGV